MILQSLRWDTLTLNIFFLRAQAASQYNILYYVFVNVLSVVRPSNINSTWIDRVKREQSACKIIVFVCVIIDVNIYNIIMCKNVAFSRSSDTPKVYHTHKIKLRSAISFVA